MITPDLRRKIKELEVQAVRLVSGRFMGEWASNMRGQGLEFRDLREYVSGDDVRRIDWKATARSANPQLRQFSEERQQQIWIALDVSASMTHAKAELARTLTAVLSWAAVKQGDPFGVMGFSDTAEFHRRPAKGETQLWAAAGDIVSFTPVSKKTDFSAVWDFFCTRVTDRATLIIISDFQCPLDRVKLNALAQWHDVIAFQISDAALSGAASSGTAAQADTPKRGSDGSPAAAVRSAHIGRLFCFEDAETGEMVWFDAADKQSREECARIQASFTNNLHLQCMKAGIWHEHFTAPSDFMMPLISFFHRRREVRGA